MGRKVGSWTVWISDKLQGSIYRKKLQEITMKNLVTVWCYLTEEPPGNILLFSPVKLACWIHSTGIEKQLN